MSAVSSALVIGGGIAGPVTAIALHRAGIRATVLEAHLEPTDGIGSALALAPNGMAALDVVGAADAMRALALPITRTEMVVGTENLGALPVLADLPPLQMVDRSDLHRVLRERALTVGVRMEYGKRLEAVEPGRDAVTARFADGTTATADVLIGADGVRSQVRTLIDPKAPAAGWTGLLGFGGVADIDIDVAPGTMVFAFGKRAYHLYWTLADGRVAWGSNLPSKSPLSLTRARAVGASEWLSRLRTAHAGDDPGERLVAATTPETLDVFGALHIMPPVPHWSRDRMVLVGDAVHAPSNSTGQGASLAIESAVELARCLRDHADVADAFADYERRRRPRVERITRRGARINHAKAPGPVARRFLQLVLPIAFRHMNAEKQLGAEQRYTIDWEAPAGR